VFVTFVLIFKFIFIYLLYVLFVLKINGIFKRSVERDSFKAILLFFISSTMNET